MREYYEESLQPVWANRITESYSIIRRSSGMTISNAELSELLDGAFDTHIHAGPDSFARRCWSEAEVACKACDYHMGGVVFKLQAGIGSARQEFVQQLADRYANDKGLDHVKVFSGVVLNKAVGGINPYAVEASLAMGGKYVWTPTRDAAHHKKASGAKDSGIEVVDGNGDLIPEMYDILDMVAAKDGILGLSHQSTSERFLITEEALKRGVKKIVIEHPQMHVNRMTIEQMKEIRDKGAYIGICYASAVPSFLGADIDRAEVAEIIHTLGTERLVAQTDLTQFQTCDPVEGLFLFAKILLSLGVTEDEIRKIFVDNPKELLL